MELGLGLATRQGRIKFCMTLFKGNCAWSWLGPGHHGQTVSIVSDIILSNCNVSHRICSFLSQ